jgi:hypothetical protein
MKSIYTYATRSKDYTLIYEDLTNKDACLFNGLDIMSVEENSIVETKGTSSAAKNVTTRYIADIKKYINEKYPDLTSEENNESDDNKDGQNTTGDGTKVAKEDENFINDLVDDKDLKELKAIEKEEGDIVG